MKIRYHLKFVHQLSLAFGSMVLLAVLLAALGWDQIKVIQHHFNGVVDRTLPTLSALADVQERLQQVRIAELQHLTALTMPEKDTEEVRAKEAAKVFDAAVKNYFDVSAELGDTTLLTQLKTSIAAFHSNRTKFFQMSYSAAGAEIARAQDAREYFNGEGLQAFQETDGAVRELKEYHTRQADAAKALGAAALASAVQLMLSVSVAIIVLSVLLATYITRRLMRQLGGEPSHAAYIAQRIADGDLYVPIPFKPVGDQSLMGVMGKMQKALNEMVSELRETQGRLVAAARQAGMAEIATNVLHNVGNILNSVNVSADLVSSTLHTSKAKGLTRAVQMIEEHAGDLGEFLTHDDKGKLLPSYVSKISHALMLEQQGMMQELGHLTQSINHIKNVVATQQSYAGRSSLLEPVRICDLVEDALRINGASLSHHQVTVEREFADVPLAQLDKTRVLQILVNLISNAKNAMEGVTDRAHRLTLQVELVGHKLRVCVKDVGQGIDPANLTRIFLHGFTTRKEGHGFGLHSCALAANEMGGTLSAYSEGPGRGAAFTLELPINAVQGKQ